MFVISSFYNCTNLSSFQSRPLAIQHQHPLLHKKKCEKVHQNKNDSYVPRGLLNAWH